MGKRKNKPSGYAIQCRVLLIALLLVIAESKSYWYTINGDLDWGFSLGKRLGFKTLESWRAFQIEAKLGRFKGRNWEVLSHGWDELIELAATDFPEAKDLLQKGFGQIDCNALANGTPPKKQDRAHVLRVGTIFEGYAKDFKNQRDDRGNFIVNPFPMTEAPSKGHGERARDLPRLRRDTEKGEEG